jgi:subtilisin family serine protease
MPVMKRSITRVASLFGLAASMSAFALADSTPATGRLLVKFGNGVSPATASSYLNQAGAKEIGSLSKLGVKVVSVPAGKEKAASAALARKPGVVFASPDFKVALSATPNDPMFGNQWHHAKIGTPTAWDTVIGLGTVTVAILDTGCDPLHPDLMSKYVHGWNTYEGNSNFADVHGHGTAVAGSAAAITNNGLGVAGVAWNCQIMPIRISDLNGYGYSSTVADALVYAADRGARVANISYQFSYDPTVLWGCQYFQSKGGVVTISAGNTGSAHPGSDTPYALTVSATDGNDNLASWSTTGPAVDISAPGVNIQSTNRGGGYGGWSGTSFSAPITAGVAALVVSANLSLSASQIQDVLTGTAFDRGTAGWDSLYGWGRVDANAAVQRALSLQGYVDNQAPSVVFVRPTNGATVSNTTSVEVNATDDTGVTSVSFYVNGTLVATDTSAPYTYSWDTTALGNGSHNLRAEARDARDNVGSAQIGVTVSNTVDTIPPVTTITSPKTNTKIRGSLSVSAAATDNVGVTKVELWVNGVLKSTDTSAPFSFSVGGKQLSSGTHTLVTKAYDARNNVGTSSPVTVIK